MENISATQEAALTPDSHLLQQLRTISGNMAAWMKFLGIIYIIQAAITTLFTFFVGILVAWLPLWLGILLFQAGNRASSAAVGKNPQELIPMLDKLRLFFIINGIVLIIFLAIGIMTMIFIGGNFFSFMHQFQQTYF